MNTSAWRLVVIFVGLSLLLDVGGIILLTLHHINSPQIMDVIAGSALTGLVGLLANPREGNTP